MDISIKSNEKRRDGKRISLLLNYSVTEGELSRIVSLVIRVGRRWHKLMAWALKELCWGEVGTVVVISEEDIYLPVSPSSTGSVGEKVL